MDNVVYFLSIIFVGYVSVLLYAKIHSPFWFHQPVFHTYELYPRLLNFSKQPYYKKTRPPTNGIFCDTKHITTSSVSDVDDLVWGKIVSLIQGHFVDSQYVLNHTNAATMKNTLYGDSQVSCFYEDVISHNTSTRLVTEKLDTENLTGMIASRPVIIRFLKYPEKNDLLYEFVYVCVHDEHKKKNRSRNLIQTHIYQHRLHTGGYVFQKHTDLCKAVVPLVKYQTYTFVLRDTPIRRLPRNYSIRCLNKTHVDLWRGIYIQMTAQYEISLLPDFQYTLDWLQKGGRYTIYVTIYKVEHVEHVHGVYLFEDAKMSWEKEELNKPDMVRLAAAVIFGGYYHHHHDKDNVLFFRGFLNCLHAYLSEDVKRGFGILEIPSISNNDAILALWREKYELRNETQSAYYLYNLIYPSSPISPSQFILL